MVEAPPSEWSVDRLRAEVESRTWFHTIEIRPGLCTPGEEDTIAKAPHMRIPEDLTGLTVLDVGAYDGYFSFEAERRGAARVLATDDWTWNWPGSDARRNFDLVRDVRNSNVESHEVSVEALSVAEIGGRFDVVLFLGVLYHAPDPIGYLKNVREVTQGFAIIETLVDLLDVPMPAAAYYGAASLNGDASNHFGPNTAAVEGWLLEAGFSRVDAFPPWHTEPEYAIDVTQKVSPARRVRRRLGRRQRSGRQVFHASRDQRALVRTLNAMDLTHELTEQLTWHWDNHVRPRLDGLTDDEYFWEPVAGCWSIRRRGETQTSMAAGSGDWVADFEFPEPQPVPVTTIAWRLAHLRVGIFGARSASHFGGPPIDYSTAEWTSDAKTAIAQLDEEYARWVAGVSQLDEAALARPVGDKEPYPDLPFAALVLHINREAIHHASEVLLLRDLYRSRS